MLLFALINTLFLLNTVNEFDLNRIKAGQADSCWKNRYFSGKVSYVL
jgi:hypothetical protein